MLAFKSVLYSSRVRRRNSSGATLSFMITEHTRSNIGRCMEALQQACALMRREWGKWSPCQAACSCILAVHARYH